MPEGPVAPSTRTFLIVIVEFVSWTAFQLISCRTKGLVPFGKAYLASFILLQPQYTYCLAWLKKLHNAAPQKAADFGATSS